MMKSRIALLLAGLALAACGGAEPGFDEEQGLDEEGELDTVEQAMVNIDPCATGVAMNATSTIPKNGDSYTRSASQANPGGPCGANPRHATYVELTSPPSHIVNVSVRATYPTPPYGFCPLNNIVFKVDHFIGGNWAPLHDVTIPAGYTANGDCYAFGGYGIQSVDATGRYRIRTVAPRWDGPVNTVTIWADDIAD